MGWLKKLIPKEIRNPVKKVLDPIIDFGTSVVKAVISPFTGAFSIPDINFDTGFSNDQIREATTVNFKGGNRAIPVLYGNHVEIATIPVYANTWGLSSINVKNYLYVMYVISQGFTCGKEPFDERDIFYIGSKLQRMLVDNKPVNLRNPDPLPGTNVYSNPIYNYSNTPLLVTDTTPQWTVTANGKNGRPVSRFDITKGTFADRLRVRYFDGSGDQPARLAYVTAHPELEDDMKMRGVSFLFCRFTYETTDEVVGGTDGNGTFPNPYSGIPGVVVTVPGRAVPRIVGYNDNTNYYPNVQETFYTTPSKMPSDGVNSYHRRYDRPDAGGRLQIYDSIDSAGSLTDATYIQASKTATVVGDGVTIVPRVDIQFTKSYYFQPEKMPDQTSELANMKFTSTDQGFNIHNYLKTNGWTEKYVCFVPWYMNALRDSTGELILDSVGNLTGVTDMSDQFETTSISTSNSGEYLKDKEVIWLENVGGNNYQFMDRTPRHDKINLKPFGYSIFGYNDLRLENVYGFPPVDSTGQAYYDFACASGATNDVLSLAQTQSQRRIYFRDPATNFYQSYLIDYYQILSTGTVRCFLLNEDNSSVDHVSFHRSLPKRCKVFLDEIGFTSTNCAPCNWDHTFENGYLNEGVSYQGYSASDNPVEHLLDYMLNSNYGAAVPLSKIDKNSFIEAASAIKRSFEFAADDYARQYYFGYQTDRNVVEQQLVNTYLNGPEADTPLAQSHFYGVGGSGMERSFIVRPDQSHFEVINNMLGSMGAFMPYINGKYYLILENAGIPDDNEAVPPVSALPLVTTFTEDDVVGSIVMKNPGINDRYNRVKLNFTNFEKDSQADSVIYPGPLGSDSTDVYAAYLLEDNNKPLERDVTYDSIRDDYTAGIKARLLLKKSRGQLTVEFTTTFKAYNVCPGDFIQLDFTTFGVSGVFRVTSVKSEYNSQVGITCIKHDPNLYDITANGDVTYTRPGLTS